MEDIEVWRLEIQDAAGNSVTLEQTEATTLDKAKENARNLLTVLDAYSNMRSAIYIYDDNGIRVAVID